MKAIDITVSGKVQGVFFRASTKDEALSCNVKGWCKNQRDGTVFIHAEGESANLEKFVRWCHHGPPMSKVAKVSTKDSQFSGMRKFEIRRF